ncbi:tachylectin-related carbohydrate-binding protein [Streptomyces sp. NPDC001741]|uniref:tachylectin-related carbohydrate-binding protein n=1 Tax=Streptomyces sp. NPDC001741 TaxID=3364605 RepID=UPI0036839437
MADDTTLAIYGISPEGALQWYRHNGRSDGTNRWTAGGGGNNVSDGWNIYSTVFSGGNGVIYGITPEGALQWYRHDGYTDGTNRWTAGGGGNNVSDGWNIYSTVFSDTAQSVAVPAASPPAAKPATSPPQPASGILLKAFVRSGGAKRLGKIRMPPAAVSAGEIIYKRSVFDATGALVVEEGRVAAGANTPVPVGPLHVPRESFSYRHTFVDESGALRARAGDITVTADLRLQIGIVKLEGSVDGEKLTANGYAEVVTVRVDGSASFGAPGAGGSATGHAVGPNAHMSGEAGPNGVGGEIGLSAGEIGGQLGVTIGGQPFGVGGEIGLKAELGLHWAATSTITLPLITISGPNPLAGVTSFAIGAVNDLARDPVRTAEQAINDIAGVGIDAVEEVGQIVKSIAGIFGDDDEDEEDKHTVTRDEWGDPKKHAPPGQVLFDR